MRGRMPNPRADAQSCFFLLLSLILLGMPVRAQEYELKEEEHLQGEHWIKGGQKATINGTATDDLFLISNEVFLHGTFRDDIWAAGLKVEFDGSAEDDLRVGSAYVAKIDGTVEGTLTVRSSNIVVQTNTVAHGVAKLYAQEHATINGTFGSDLEVDAAVLTLNGSVNGDLYLNVNDVRFGPLAKIAGDLYYGMAEPPSLPNPEILSGEIRKLEKESSVSSTWTNTLWLIGLTLYFSALVTGLLFVRLLPRAAGTAVEYAYSMRFRSILIGMTATLLGGLFSFLLISTTVAWAAGVVLAMFLGVLFYVGKIIAALMLGAMVLRSDRSLNLTRLTLGLILGLAIIAGLSLIPQIGVGVFMAMSWWGMGAILQVIFQSQRSFLLQQPAGKSPDPVDPPSST